MLTCPALRRKRDRPVDVPCQCCCSRRVRHLPLFPELRSLHLNQVDFDKSTREVLREILQERAKDGERLPILVVENAKNSTDEYAKEILEFVNEIEFGAVQETKRRVTRESMIRGEF